MNLYNYNYYIYFLYFKNKIFAKFEMIFFICRILSFPNGAGNWKQNKRLVAKVQVVYNDINDLI